MLYHYICRQSCTNTAFCTQISRELAKADQPKKRVLVCLHAPSPPLLAFSVGFFYRALSSQALLIVFSLGCHPGDNLLSLGTICCQLVIISFLLISSHVASLSSFILFYTALCLSSLLSLHFSLLFLWCHAFFIFLFIFIEVQLIYNVVNSFYTTSDLIISIHIFFF